jgi:predicted DNA-binding transcriptional regulator YafY
VKRQTRLFALAEHLRGRKTGVTAEVLADRFGVSLRTMYRDLDTLQEAALPLKAERGRGGGYALDKNYFLPPIALSAREAALLVALAEHALLMRTVPFAETTSTALDKLRAALTASAQRELLDHMKTLRFAGIPALPVKEAVRKVIEQAFFERATVDVSYESPRGEAKDGFLKHRRVRLRNVVMEGSLVLLNVTDVDSGEERQLRLDRIATAVIAEDVPPLMQ